MLCMLQISAFAQTNKADTIFTKKELTWLKNNRKKIRYAPNPSWPPGDYLEKKVHKGIIADYIKIFEEKLGISFQKVYFDSWPDIIEGLKTEKVDFVGAIQRTKERESFLLFSDSFITIPLVILVKDDFNSDLSNKQINKMKLACASGYSSLDYVKETFPNAEIIECKDDLTALLKTSMGKTDGTIVDLLVASHLVEKYGISNLNMAIELDYSWEIRLGVRKDCPELFSILNKTLNTISEKERKNVYNKWIGIKGVEKKSFFEKNLKIILLYLSILTVLFIVFLGISISLKRIVKIKTKDLLTAKEIAEEKKLQIQQITNNLTNGMVYQVVAPTEDERHFTFVSDKVKQFYGCTPEEVKRNADLIYSKVHKDDIERLLQEELSALKNMSVLMTEVRMINPEGKIRWSYFVSSPRVYKGVVFWDGIEIDITDRKRNEQELIEAKSKAEESDKLKSAFLANLSHEIRTPMNSILGFSELLKNPKLTSEKKDKYIDNINNSGNYLLSVINDIIEISKIDSGMISPNNTTFCINQTVREILESSKCTIPKNKDLILTVDESVVEDNTLVFSDEVKLKQVIYNLITNAIKYTPQGTIAINYSIKENNTLHFNVKDTGIGIDKKYHKIIFERFRQVDLGEGNLQSGSGLGLAISKSYIELMGGTIHIESEPGIGSTFWFEVPIQITKYEEHCVTPEKNVRSEDLQKEQPIGNDCKILVAEDDETNCFYISELLSEFNYTLLHANNGKEAVDIAKNNPDICLILLDLKMPVMNGYEAFNQIRKFNPYTPIIAQTAYALTDDIKNIESTGFNDFITKPIDGDKLIKLINKHLLYNY